MTHEDVVERLHDLCHGRLDDRIATEVQAHLTACEECRALSGIYRILHVSLSSGDGMEREDHPTSEQIVAFAENREQLDAQLTKSISDHLARCDACADQTKRTRRVFESIRKRPEPVLRGVAEQAPWSRSVSRWGALAAAALVAMLAYPAFLGLVRLPSARVSAQAAEADLERLQDWSGPLALNVLPRSLREGAVPTVTVGPDQPFAAIALELLVPRGVLDTEILRISIHGSDGDAVWSLELTASRLRSDIAEWGVVTLLVSSERLQPGRHLLDVVRVDHPDEDPLLRVAFDVDR